MPPQRRGADDRHRMEAVEDAALQVQEEPVGGVGDARGNRDEQDAGQQVVDIGPRPGLDGAAEDVDEEQQEGDRHEGGGDDGVGAARDVAQGASEHHEGVAQELGLHCGTSCFLSWSLSPPTTARKISSRVGCFSTYSSFAGGSSLRSSPNVPETMITPSCRMAMRSASFSASSRDWVVRNTVTPLLARVWITCHTSMRPSGSRPV